MNGIEAISLFGSIIGTFYNNSLYMMMYKIYLIYNLIH